MIDDKKKQRQTLVALVVCWSPLRDTPTGRTAHPARAARLRPQRKLPGLRRFRRRSMHRFRLDLINDKPHKDTVGQRNVFLYYVPPKPPPPLPPPAPVAISRPQAPITPPGSVTPPIPPSLLSTFKYDGIGISAIPGKMMASIDDGSGNRFNVGEGEYILGRYRIVRVTEPQVEIEDTDQNRRQTYSRKTQ